MAACQSPSLFFFGLFWPLVLLPAAYDPSPASRTVVDACVVLDSCSNAPGPFAKSDPAACVRDVTSGLKAGKFHNLDIGPFAG
jgi:hypothetical protein